MRTVLYALALALLAATGCFPQQTTFKEPPPGVPTLPPARPVRLVTPDQVTPDNVQQISQALAEEMKQAQQDLPPATTSGTPVPEGPRR